MATREKNIWILIVFILAGIVVGGLLRRTSRRNRMAIMAKLRTKLRLSRTSSLRPKHSKTNIRNNNQNKHSKHNRNGNSAIHL